MKRRHNRHFEPRHELKDISASLPAKDSILVLEANDVKPRIVQKISGLNVFVDGLVIDLKAHVHWIVVGAAGIRHHHHTGVQIQAIERDRPMKIMGEGRDAAAPRQMIADEGDTLERTH
jgi:hypothetical protein